MGLFRLGAGERAQEMESLPELVGKVVTVLTLDGRTLVGALRGLDALCNLVLADAHERVFLPAGGCEREALGLFLVRGDTVAIVGELDADEDAKVDWDGVRGTALPNVTHGFAGAQ